MVSTPIELIATTQALVDALDANPAGLCAIASVALWLFWKERAQEDLVLCIGFSNNVANHVFLRQGSWMFDPTSHQFDSHERHWYVASSKSTRHVHHRTTVETTCIQHFHDILGMVGWPAHQWPTKEKVNALLNRLGQLRAA